MRQSARLNVSLAEILRLHRTGAPGLTPWDYRKVRRMGSRTTISYLNTAWDSNWISALMPSVDAEWVAERSEATLTYMCTATHVGLFFLQACRPGTCYVHSNLIPSRYLFFVLSPASDMLRLCNTQLQVLVSCTVKREIFVLLLL